MQIYLHQRSDWPHFRWDEAAFADQLASLKERRLVLFSAMATLGFERRQETILSVLTEDVQRSSEIEGEHLDAAKVRSSVARRLGMDVAGLPVPDRDVEGVVEMMLDATQKYDQRLTVERLFAWHASLFPTGRSGMSKILVGKWRDDAHGPMQVVSGPLGHEKIHYEAPAATRIDEEINSYLEWFENHPMDALLKAAIGHLWFEAIHPFDDGNGRIGRAIMDMALARADGMSQRFYSMTSQINAERKDYYDLLERTLRASMDVTQWIQWFFACLDKALGAAEGVLEIVRVKTRFWQLHSETALNERQHKLLNLMLDGFKGKLQTAKYAKIAKCSTDTALRDLADLVSKGVLVRDEAGGRSTSYHLVVAG